jgi:two-component system LytT family response regulator
MADRLRVLVADDELLARRRLVRLLGAMPDVTIAGECDSGEAVLARVGEGDVDVVLLDIQMPGLSGIEALQLMPADGPTIVFCTAHPDHALTAYDAGAIDYVLKPVEAPRLRRALERARSRDARRRRPVEESTPARDAPLQRLAVSTAKGIVLLDPAEVSHAVLDGELVKIYSAQGEYLSDLSLGELHERLPGDRFERVHRRALVNFAEVVRLDPTDSGGYVARLRSGHAVEVSRQAARALRRRLGLR